MADEEFEIDVYGDAENDQGQQAQDQGQGAAEEEYAHQDDQGNVDTNGGGAHDEAAANEYNEAGGDDGFQGQDDDGQQTAPAPQQGVKRKQEPDDRPTDPRATSALLISDMQWWNTEDEIRGWINAASCEDELKDITFSEHKVNGKSKGQVYVEFTSAQAATATKRHIDGMQSGGDGGSNQQRRATVVFHNAHNNPFKTLPKDAPQRQNRDTQIRGNSAGGNYSNGPPATNFQAGGGGAGGGFQGNFRGGRGGFNRGGMRGGFGQNYGNNMNPYNNNNNTNMGGFNNMGGGGFGRGGMGGGFGRGGPNMRGRGGMNNMMGSVPPMMGGNMGMGGMMPGMNMMGGGMGGMGFNPMSGGQFNPNFFGGNQGGGNYGGNQQGGGGDWGNPHGAKRPRGE